MLSCICRKDGGILSNVLTSIGIITVEQILDISNRFPSITVDKHIVMPTHFHLIVIINNVVEAGASPRPTLMDAVGVIKSFSTRICNKMDGVVGRQIWQESFYDEVIQTSEAYNNIWQYIDNNPAKWVEDRYYVE